MEDVKRALETLGGKVAVMNAEVQVMAVHMAQVASVSQEIVGAFAGLESTLVAVFERLSAIEARLDRLEGKRAS